MRHLEARPLSRENYNEKILDNLQKQLAERIGISD